MSWKDRRDQRIAAKAIEIFTPRMREFLNADVTSDGPDGRLSFFQVFGTRYGQLYRRNSALGSVVNFLAKNIAPIHMKVSAENAEGVRLPASDHPVQRLIDHPMPGIPYTRLMRGIVADKAIYDVAAVLKIRENFDPTPNEQTRRIRNSGEVRNLMRLPIPRITVAEASLAGPRVFNVVLDQAGSDRAARVPAEDIIWMPGYSPDSNTYGTPPVEQLRQMLAEEWAAGKNQENLWKNGPAVDVVFLQENSTQGLDEASALNFRESWRNKYGGVRSPQAREWPLLPPGIKPEALAIDAKAAEYIATRQLSREECCRAFGFAPQLLGITPANFASVDMYHQMLYQDVITTWTTPIQEEFEEQLLREFEDIDSGVYIDFNINAKLAGSFLEQAKIGQQAVGGPWMTRNEFREKFQGLPPVEGGDEIIVPLNVVLGGGPQANPQDAQNQFATGEIVDLERARTAIASGGPLSAWVTLKDAAVLRRQIEGD